MVDTFRIPDINSIGKAHFVVGTTRSKIIYSDLDTCPHLLVAGQTGKGKSTFSRQLITSLYLNDKSARFTLIDLKGGLEFQLFERLDRVTVPESIKKALYAIEEHSSVVDNRMQLLKANRCKDITAYFALKAQGKTTTESKGELNRHIIVVDEAAEMFLAGSHASAQEIQTAKRVLSKIARQGRSLGVHLVVATQRPDTKALDPQVKANLSGVVCFQMANDASSITVLGNGRATDLPAAPGRAIWKLGGEMIEVQTPLLETMEVEKLLEQDYREPIVQISTPPKEEKANDKINWKTSVEE
jgi:S-DNA-T family DNA segregation ATPase FtsK/SpoIIIE